jgi:hypothetical protein
MECAGRAVACAGISPDRPTDNKLRFGLSLVFIFSTGVLQLNLESLFEFRLPICAMVVSTARGRAGGRGFAERPDLF